MGRTKSAKVLSGDQVAELLRFVRTDTNFPKRNEVIVLLSFHAGLRSVEIASLRWEHLIEANGSLARTITLTNEATKGKRSGREIPMSPLLYDALSALREDEHERGRDIPHGFVITMKRGLDDPKSRARSVQFLFREWFASLGLRGASSHSGRRTMITRAATRLSQAGASINDLKALSGHANTQTLMLYIDENKRAKRTLVETLYNGDDHN